MNKLVRANTLDIVDTNGRITGIPQAFKRVLRLVVVLGVLCNLSDAPVFKKVAKILARHLSRFICFIKITLNQFIVQSLVTEYIVRVPNWFSPLFTIGQIWYRCIQIFVLFVNIDSIWEDGEIYAHQSLLVRHEKLDQVLFVCRRKVREFYLSVDKFIQFIQGRLYRRETFTVLCSEPHARNTL